MTKCKNNAFGLLLPVLLLPVLAALILLPSRASAQDIVVSPLTGQVQIIWLETPQWQIRVIREHIRNREFEKALKVAREFVEETRSTKFAYEAGNALCIALRKSGDPHAALDVCNNAIALKPDRWEALNSRGSVHFDLHRYDEALADYEASASAAARSKNTKEFVPIPENNISVTRKKITPS